jgi:hypothetical chaperone protein
MSGLIGIDFGTTNSVVAILQPDGSVQTTRYAVGTAELDVFRTLLCFWTEHGQGRSGLRHAAGPFAVEAYLDDPLDCRLIMSMKTYLAQRSFTQTNIFGRLVTLEQLIALFLQALLQQGHGGAQVVAGRYVLQASPPTTRSVRAGCAPPSHKPAFRPLMSPWSPRPPAIALRVP